jgi:putative superfamily III holin-X
MADTVDTAGSFSPADEAEKPPDARSVGPEDEAEGRQAEERQEEAEEAEGRDGEAEEPGEREVGTEEAEDARSLTELFEQLGRDLSDLAVSETQLEAARNMPEVRRAARDLVGTLVVVLAALTAFAFVNVAAMDGLSRVLDAWLAALVLAAVWIVVGGVLLFGFMGRARQWLFWIVFKAPPSEAVEELEQERNAPGRPRLARSSDSGRRYPFRSLWRPFPTQAMSPATSRAASSR